MLKIIKNSEYLSNIVKNLDLNEYVLRMILLTLNNLNLYLFMGTKYCAINTLILFVIYLAISKDKNKKNLFLTWIIFSIFTLISESVIIKNINNSLYYYNADIYNVPSWLFTAYCSMVVGVYIIKDVLKSSE